MVGKMRWGDSVEMDDEGDFEMALPPPQVRDRDPTRPRAVLLHRRREKDLAALAIRRDRRRLTLFPPEPAPAPQITGPDANGVKTVVEYRQKDDGSKVRVRRERRRFQP
jgi:hypothetical protein